MAAPTSKPAADKVRKLGERHSKPRTIVSGKTGKLPAGKNILDAAFTAGYEAGMGPKRKVMAKLGTPTKIGDSVEIKILRNSLAKVSDTTSGTRSDDSAVLAEYRLQDVIRRSKRQERKRRDKSKRVEQIKSALKKSGFDEYEVIFDASPIARAFVVREGIQPTILPAMAVDLGVSRETLFEWGGLPRTTVNRKMAEQKPLSVAESDSALAIASLLGQVTKMLGESGSVEGFDAGAWLGHWLGRPHEALGGVAPGTLLDTTDGRALVSRLLGQLQSGAFA